MRGTRKYLALAPRAGIYLVLTLGAVVFAYPFVWMAVSSLKPEMEITNLALWSPNLGLHNYAQVIRKIPVLRAFVNSVLVSTLVTGSVLVFSSMGGYALAKLRFRGSSVLIAVILFTMMVPMHVTLIPSYILMVKLRWTDTYLALIVPFAVSGFAVLVFRQFFLSVPTDLIDAARVDGCGEFRILTSIVWPLSRPAIATVAVLTFMSTWNEVLWPLIVIKKFSRMTLPQLVTLFAVGGQAEGQLGMKLAAATLLALPIVLAYSFLQRYFIASMATTGLKG
ncbi:MAG: carbohydrate ABC transporter permease [candidate division KSB1 bacterium]|nr:carbohydrate ABC transporter permease [candidate division KSB1 bacterium]